MGEEGVKAETNASPSVHPSYSYHSLLLTAIVLSLKMKNKRRIKVVTNPHERKAHPSLNVS